VDEEFGLSTTALTADYFGDGFSYLLFFEDVQQPLYAGSVFPAGLSFLKLSHPLLLLPQLALKGGHYRPILFLIPLQLELQL
jgi:hypothetical protein